jgi:transposase-like protein
MNQRIYNGFMAMNKLSKAHLHSEEAAINKLESILWPNGPVCPRCNGQKRITKVNGKTARLGLWRCGPCKRQFTVTVGTLFERSHVPMHYWFQAVYLLAASKKGFSACQLERTLGVTYKTAWFMAHRIREAMRSGDLAPFGVDGGAVEVDETFIGRKKGVPKRSAWHHKLKVLTLIDRDTKQARSVVVDNLRVKTLAPILRKNLTREARLMTDEATHYKPIGREFAEHGVVNHRAEEWVRGDVYTNTAEGFFSVFKRGMKGVYQHCSEGHLHRYLAEYDFRYNNRQALGIDDERRAEVALSGVVGKRLYFRQPA